MKIEAVDFDCRDPRMELLEPCLGAFAERRDDVFGRPISVAAWVASIIEANQTNPTVLHEI
jgi:hypothetical protein